MATNNPAVQKSSGCKDSLSDCLVKVPGTYEEVQVVKIRSFTCGILLWGARIVIAVLIIVFPFYQNQGWHKIDTKVESAVVTKVFGMSKSTTPSQRVWDNADYQQPPKENGAFTVITSILQTDQNQSLPCGEDPDVPAANCTSDADCTAGQPVKRGNGFMTGVCVTTDGVCEVNAWCPVERLSDTRHDLSAENFTVLILNYIVFPMFDERRENVPDDLSEGELNTCVYPDHDKHCPMFEVGRMVKEAGSKYSDMSRDGGVIEIIIEWDCNFDELESECLPTYQFKRLDRPDYRLLTDGFHLRYAEHYLAEGGTWVRRLYRAYGIRFIITVYGKGYKFDLIKSVLTLGSCLSYFGGITAVLSMLIRVYGLCWPFCGEPTGCCTRKCGRCGGCCRSFCEMLCCRPFQSLQDAPNKPDDTVHARVFSYNDSRNHGNYWCRNKWCSCCAGEGQNAETSVGHEITTVNTAASSL